MSCPNCEAERSRAEKAEAALGKSIAWTDREKLRSVEAERDRYREALEALVRRPLPKWACDIIRRALESKDE